MKLNIDCIRDILIFIEDNTTARNMISINSDQLPEKLNNKYDTDTIIYHILQCSKSGLIDGFKQFDDYGSILISDLSPQGHAFLADARNKNIWNKIKKLGCESLPTIISILPEIAKSYFLNQ
ncbi:DUF2513 domain-containing protein [Anaerofustis stercorihominis]|uniref:DUF2513 domain-containing protein n=1 Tax=Anaerofustis stercorihominis TaxID=214853 RepID=UPI002671D5B2|nr:DUF2513 domain-containing protein [Anaerofustis stercorihominis]